MAATPEGDVRHALACWRAEMRAATLAEEQANADKLRANKGIRACLRKMYELGIEE